MAARADMSAHVALVTGGSRGIGAAIAVALVEAGADAIELHFFHSASCMTTGAADVERQAIEIVRDVKARVKIPIAVKIAPLFTAARPYPNRW